MIVSAPKYERVTDDPEVQAAIRRVVDEAPPLTTAQIADLRALFRPIRPKQKAAPSMREAA